MTGNLPLNLSRRDADVAIRATTTPPDTLVGRKVARIAWAPYAARRLAGMHDPASLLETGAWVGFGDAMAGLAGAARLRTLPPERIATRFDSVSGMRAAVMAGLGIGLLPCFAGDGEAGLMRPVRAGPRAEHRPLAAHAPGPTACAAHSLVAGRPGHTLNSAKAHY